MLIKGTEGCLPLPNSAVRLSAAAGSRRTSLQNSRYDHLTLSTPAEQEKRSFQEAVASLSSQVRTTNTTGKIQELRRQVSSGT